MLYPLLQGLEGFLPRSQHKAAYGEDATLSVGQLQEVGRHAIHVLHNMFNLLSSFSV